MEKCLLGVPIISLPLLSLSWVIAGIVIYCAEVVSVFKMGDRSSKLFSTDSVEFCDG